MLSDDYIRILSLARAAMQAEKSVLWKTDTDAAIERHSERCNALWDELRRQVALQDGCIPEIEPPGVVRRDTIKAIRAEVLEACRQAISNIPLASE